MTVSTTESTTIHLSPSKGIASMMPTSQETNTTGEGFFKLPAELRNSVYEYVLADVRDNIYIKLECGDNKAHESRAITPDRPVFRDDTASPLSMLLTCKQINLEASPMPYSKMSMSMSNITTMVKDFESLREHRGEVSTKFAETLKSVFVEFNKTFAPEKSSLIKTVVLREVRDLTYLTTFDYYLTPGHLSSGVFFAADRELHSQM
jgi:hypothetical protein